MLRVGWGRRVEGVRGCGVDKQSHKRKRASRYAQAVASAYAASRDGRINTLSDMADGPRPRPASRSLR